MTIAVERGFVRIPSGLVHYRFADPEVPADALPLYMAHSGPGSSRGLLPMIDALGATRRVIAPDLLGNGDSAPHRLTQPELADYADDVVAVLDTLGIGCVDFYGQHTGAHIGAELALRHPTRVRRLVLDGIALFDDEFRVELLARYAPVVEPDDHGGHLAWAWNFVRSLGLHWPHYRQDPAHRLTAGAVPPPVALHQLATDLLKALPTYHLAYQAVFRQPTAERLGCIRHRTLVMAINGDPLARYLDEAVAALPGSTRALVSRERRAEPVHDFLIA